MGNLSIDNKTEKVRAFEEDPYKTKKLLQPLDIQRHRNFRNIDQDGRGVFFSFL